jgi:YHS domain-containing protein
MVTAGTLAAAFLAAPLTLSAQDKAKSGEKGKPYPLKKCIVSDEELGSMGDAYTFVHKGQEIKLCCKSCKKDFDKNPDKFLKKLEAPKDKK